MNQKSRYKCRVTLECRESGRMFERSKKVYALSSEGAKQIALSLVLEDLNFTASDIRVVYLAARPIPKENTTW